MLCLEMVQGEILLVYGIKQSHSVSVTCPHNILIFSNFFCQQMHSLLKYKMLQLTVKISLCGLLHVSVCSDRNMSEPTKRCFKCKL
jgi:hypothetical protein